MKIKTIVSHLKRMVELGHGEDIICFRTKDNDKLTITDTFIDDDDDVCLYAGEGDSYSVDDLLESLDDGYYRFVYVYCPYTETYYSIEGVWFVDNSNDLVINLTNYIHEESSPNWDNDDDDWDDEDDEWDEDDDDDWDDEDDEWDEDDDDDWDEDDDDEWDDEDDDDEWDDEDDDGDGDDGGGNDNYNDDECDDESDDRSGFFLDFLYLNT